jgi:ornithine decarboxylase
VIQLGTYDGTVYNARQVVDKIGSLCDYILFDSAWVGYEQFIPMMADCSPLLLDLTPDDPGIFVTQSVHKQQAGFSQTSQIHKKDNHLRGQERFCPHKRLNNAFMLHASTSPFYPLFAALDVNAKIHEGESGRRLWAECVALGIEARKAIIANCKMIQPFIPPVVGGVRGRIIRPKPSPASGVSLALSRARAGTALKAMPAISISLTPVNCC